MSSAPAGPASGVPAAPGEARGPGQLADAIAELVVDVEAVDVETGLAEVAGYYAGEPRPTGVVSLRGGGAVGRGECVAWTPDAQAEFAAGVEVLVPLGRTTIGGIESRLKRASDDPYHRAAIEAAAIDLALGQASTDPFDLAGRPPRPVAFCRSINETADPVEAVRGILEADPGARVKIDCPEGGWDEATWESLARTDRVAVVDLKRRGSPCRPVEAHRAMPRAWLEDPPREAADRVDDPSTGDWSSRIALDGYVERAVDLDHPPLPPAAVNVKAPRMGGWLEALRCLEACRMKGWHAYVGGMFEVDVGRAQARVLASLFTADAWNDLAPLGEPSATSPLEVETPREGFARSAGTGDARTPTARRPR
ncbi:MAG: hypothetical protein R3326_02290 [Gemmatimonadota bacterium]|nr:hypothetical protein [Gemmatimonadota bacterium]